MKHGKIYDYGKVVAKVYQQNCCTLVYNELWAWK